jgi:hypothetical protein
MDDLDVDILIRHVIPFVGTNQFRFVAGVNRKFHWAYTVAFTGLFGEKRTHVHTLDALSQFGTLFQRDRETAIAFVARSSVSFGSKGNRDMIQYLRANDCSWSCDVCAFAAGRGDLPMLQLALRTGMSLR